MKPEQSEIIASATKYVDFLISRNIWPSSQRESKIESVRKQESRRRRLLLPRTKRRKKADYYERNSAYSGSKYSRSLYVCEQCNFATRSSATCPKCRTSMLSIGYRIRVPRKNASKAKWQKFWELAYARLNIKKCA